MSSTRPKGTERPTRIDRAPAEPRPATSTLGRVALLVVVLVLVAAVVIAADFVFGAISGSTSADPSSSPTAPSATPSSSRQALLDLGYTNVWNLDGGMNAWQTSGRKLVQKNR